ncbi:hypothetical protein KI688_008018 [Linnemannia hyalina]|uniref:Uncharacterized protein n=1 Tax=Linnemannia hyalina TaxID=64524 RepID=A0A9P8BYW4_9FUNG|nr:hypothetical protein KI688_008018 [Linnemannia hyalina]
MNTYPLTDRDFTVIRFRVIFHNILYILFVASICLMVAYQVFLTSSQFKARNWVGIILPLFTGMSDPRIAILHEASTPVLFIGWLSLGAEWYSAYLDTKNSVAHSYVPGDLYAERVGCIHGSPACDILTWYIMSVFATSLCFFAELVVIIHVHHREQWRDIFVGLLRRLFRCSEPSAAVTSDVGEYDIYGYPTSDPNQAPASPQPSHQIGVLPITFPHSAAVTSSSRVPFAPCFPLSQGAPAAAVSASARVELSSVRCYQAPRPQQVVDQIEVLEYLHTNNSRSLYEGESVVYSVPAHIETPHPVRGSLANLVNMLGWNMYGDVPPRVDTPHPNPSRPRQ